MSEGIVITITDYATPEVKSMAAQLTPRRLVAKIGPGLNRLVQNKLVSNGENKHGWPSAGHKLDRPGRWRAD